MAAILCLVTMVSGITWLRLGALLLVAWADSTHTPQIALLGNHVELVLHHGSAVPRYDNGPQCPPGHEHGIPAQFMVLMASDSPVHGDHVILLSKAPTTLVPAGTFAAGAPPLLSGTLPTKTFPDSLAYRMDSVAFRHCPPPLTPQFLWQHWVTVLLV